MEQKIVNRLPSKTWNWLKVNEAVLDWDNDRTTDLGAGFFAASGEGNGSAQRTSRGRMSKERMVAENGPVQRRFAAVQGRMNWRGEECWGV